MIESLYEAYDAAEPPWLRAIGVWVMDREHYDRMRSALCTEEQEMARAGLHVMVCMPAADVSPLRCPACHEGPFGNVAELSEHVTRMADPAWREPSAGDRLIGLPVTVREGGGAPHLEPAPA